MSAKEIEGWEDYTIDIKGNVFSKRRNKYLKQTVDKYGYCRVNLQKDKKYKVITIHRLVAQAFIDNPNNYPCVNHIDGNKQNNCIENLEWCTYKHNMKEAYRLGLKKPRIKEKEVVQLTKDYKIVSFWKSINEIEKELGYSSGNICEVCNCNRKSAYGYIWRYVKDE